MKAIVVEGIFDSLILEIVFPEIKEKGIMLRMAQGFSNVFAVSKTLIDYGYEVLVMLDTDSNLSGPNNRSIVDRLFSVPIEGRRVNIVWMDPSIEMVLEKAVPGVRYAKKNNKRETNMLIMGHIDAIKELTEFRQISSFIEKGL